MVNIARVFSNSRKQLAQAINPDKAAQPKRKIRGKMAKFHAFTKRRKDRKLANTLYTIYENGGEIAEAVDIYALFVVSTEPKIMADNEDDKKKLDAWWDKIDGPTFLFDATRWAIVFGESIFEKVPNMIKTKTVALKYIDGRSTELVIDDAGDLQEVLQYYDSLDEPVHFKPEDIVKICILTSADGVTGISLINRAMDNIKRSVMVAEGVSNYVMRHAFPKYHIKVKALQEGMPVPDKVLDEHEKVFEKINSKNELITDDTVEIIPLDKEGRGTVREVSEWGMTQVTSGLGVPEDLLGLNRGNTKATMRMRAFELKAGSIRHRLNKQVQLQLFEPMREQLKLSEKGKLWLEFPDINPQDEAAKAEWISKIMPQVIVHEELLSAEEAFEVGPITRDEIRELVGLGKHPEPVQSRKTRRASDMDQIKKEITRDILKAINEATKPEKIKENAQKGKTIIKKLESGLFEVTEVPDEP